MPVIANHMSRDLLTIDPEERVAEAARQMVGRGVGAVLVMDGDKLEGILTERDVLKAVATGLAEDARVREDDEPPGYTKSEATGQPRLSIHGVFLHLPAWTRKLLDRLIRDLMRVRSRSPRPRGSPFTSSFTFSFTDPLPTGPRLADTRPQEA